MDVDARGHPHGPPSHGVGHFQKCGELDDPVEVRDFVDAEIEERGLVGTIQARAKGGVKAGVNQN
jgi:hypothetical protein